MTQSPSPRGSQEPLPPIHTMSILPYNVGTHSWMNARTA
jgi:hypothetical protein